MDTFQTKDIAFQIEHRGGSINLGIDTGDNTLAISLSVVEAAQLVSILHKHINEAAVEKLRSRNG
jgi:hypothetical protein